jgi:hypothetical protein
MEERLSAITSLRMTPSMMRALEEIAQRQAVPVDVTAVIRQAIAAYIASQPSGASGREAAAFETAFVEAQHG